MRAEEGGVFRIIPAEGVNVNFKGVNLEDSDQTIAENWAKSLLERADWVILDTETTGLSRADEIVQIGILGSDGKVLFDSFVRPTQPIPNSAIAIHGITDEDVADAPTYPAVFDRLRNILAGKTVVIYNAEFDLRLLWQTGAKYNLPMPDIQADQVECAMLQYSAYVGELWADGSYKWQRLTGGDHSALGDCRATLTLIKRMAGC